MQVPKSGNQKTVLKIQKLNFDLSLSLIGFD